MNYNTKLFDLLTSVEMRVIKYKAEVRNSRIEDLTIDELRELWPFIANKFPSNMYSTLEGAVIPDPAKALITLLKMV